MLEIKTWVKFTELHSHDSGAKRKIKQYITVKDKITPKHK